MARYVMSHRRIGIADSRKAAVRADADRSFAVLFEDSADLVGRISPEEEAKREVIVFDASPTEVAAKQEELGPDVVLEPEILHYPAAISLTADSIHGGGDGATALAASAGSGQTLTVTVRGPAGPLEGAEALLTLRAVGPDTQTLRAQTDAQGKASFEFGPPWTPAVIVALPAGDHWTMVLRGPTDGATIETPRLPEISEPWWHQIVGAGSQDGAGVTVGVADTGIGPHPDAAHVTSVGAFVGGGHLSDPAEGHDVDSHGTHVCGTIGARPGAEPARPAGIAPAADVFCARVFPDAESGANQGDIANAIDHLSGECKADLINLSLGSERPSQIEREAIVEALEGGTLTICAAANAAGPVHFPAAFPESIAVSAIGVQGWGEPGSLSSLRHPSDQSKFGRDQLYLANFSCFGPQIECTAPGVGIIATVPARFGLAAPYGVMDGTSMASPVATGTLAAALSGSPQYLQLPRDLSRAAEAKAVLERGCKDIGLAPEYQGRGIPQA